MKENGFDTVHDAFFLGEVVNCMRPETSDEFYNRMSTFHDAAM